MTVAELLASCGLPLLEARMLFEHVLDKPRAWLIAHADETVAGKSEQAFAELTGRRRGGEPIAHLLGER